MTRDEVVELMKSSKTEEEWDDNCDTVKRTFLGEYPDYWFEAILASGVARETLTKFGADDKLRVFTALSDKGGRT